MLFKKVSPCRNSRCVQEIKIIAWQRRKKSYWINIKAYSFIHVQIAMLRVRVYWTWEKIEGILVKSIETSIGSSS